VIKETALLTPVAATLGAILIPILPERWMDTANRVVAVIVLGSGTLAVTAAVTGSGTDVGGQPGVGVDRLGAVFLGVGALVGFLSAILSPWYLHRGTAGFFGNGPRWYYFAFYLFWAALLAIPLAGNLGIAWVLVGLSTGVTCLLVAYSGRRRALEAGWKYLILTTLGLVVALFGIMIIYSLEEHSEASISTLDWSTLATSTPTVATPALTAALIFTTVGFAAKVGWAPVHHWLPDAHSEAPATVSALLSAALLPAVVLVVWRIDLALPTGVSNSMQLLVSGFGLLSLAVAVPFLWAPLPIKRVLAYSSLEHMGIIALGIGFANPIAVAGVLLHVCGHAVAKSLGFFATLPLFEADPSAAHRPVRDLTRISPPVATALGLSLGALSGLPPSPLFVSELLILMGGVAAGQTVVVVIAAVLLALAFVGMTRQTLDALLAPTRHRSAETTPSRAWWTLSLGLGLLLLALLVGAALVFSSPGWSTFSAGLS